MMPISPPQKKNSGENLVNPRGNEVRRSCKQHGRTAFGNKICPLLPFTSDRVIAAVRQCEQAGTRMLYW